MGEKAILRMRVRGRVFCQIRRRSSKGSAVRGKEVRWLAVGMEVEEAGVGEGPRLG